MSEIEPYPRFAKRDPQNERLCMSGCHHMHHVTWACVIEPCYGWRYPVTKVGKKATGRLRDGVQHTIAIRTLEVARHELGQSSFPRSSSSHRPQHQ